VRRFRDEVWDQIEGVYQAVLKHPFVTGLSDGSLPPEVFQHYVIQDAHYLRDYSRALAVVGAKATDDDWTVGFCQDAAAAITVERSLHAEFIAGFGLTDEQVAAVAVQPSTLAYTSYLLRTVHQGGFADGVAAILPCYWIYARVGDELLAASSPDPNYRRWIDTYGDEAFQATVTRVLGVVDQLGEQLADGDRAGFVRHVVTASKYEWMFFDAAWRLESWPGEVCP